MCNVKIYLKSSRTGPLRRTFCMASNRESSPREHCSGPTRSPFACQNWAPVGLVSDRNPWRDDRAIVPGLSNLILFFTILFITMSLEQHDGNNQKNHFCMKRSHHTLMLFILRFTYSAPFQPDTNVA